MLPGMRGWTWPEETLNTANGRLNYIGDAAAIMGMGQFNFIRREKFTCCLWAAPRPRTYQFSVITRKNRTKILINGGTCSCAVLRIKLAVHFNTALYIIAQTFPRIYKAKQMGCKPAKFVLMDRNLRRTRANIWTVILVIYPWENRGPLVFV